MSYVVFYVLLYRKMYYISEKTLGGSSIKVYGVLVGYDNSTNDTRAFD